MEDITREVAEKDGLMTVEEAVRTVFDAIQPRDPSKWRRCEGMKRRITLEDFLQSMDPCLMMTLLADYQTLHAVLYDEKGNPILSNHTHTPQLNSSTLHLRNHTNTSFE